jgi:NAD(P)-dependent dehydrogenase (short-subunit alcohol dehydrogenase family)
MERPKMTGMEETRRYFINGAHSTSALALARRLKSHSHLGLACRDLSLLSNALDLPNLNSGDDFESAEFPMGIRVFQVDAGVESQVMEAVSQFTDGELSLDGAVHFPGSVLLKPSHLTKADEWNQVLLTNLTSAFFFLKAALMPMRKQGKGSLVFLSSVAAQKGLPNHEAISAAKAGIEGLVRSAAATYPQLRINALAPGLVDAKCTEKIIQNEKALQASLSLAAIKRAGSGADVAAAVDFLLSSCSSYLTGQVLAVDGGMSTLGFPKA